MDGSVTFTPPAAFIGPGLDGAGTLFNTGSQIMLKSYRSGAVGALMDEYERAAEELTHLVERIPDDEFVRVVDAQTEDEDCRSAQTIMSHVVRSGYGYADYMREQLAIPSTRPQPLLLSRREA